jgi:phage replication initiation protein
MKDNAKAYADASGRTSLARSVKAQVYGAGKAPSASWVCQSCGCVNYGAAGTCDACGKAVAASASDACARAAEAAKGGYPTVATQDASASPINNMGENFGSGESIEAVELVMSESGKLKIQMIQRPAHDEVCVIDWINFTVLEDTWFRTARERMISDDEIVMEASRNLEKIFGFGVTSKRDTGMNFYAESWVLGDDMGFVCFGRQRGTMLVTLNGQGCTNALPGWQRRLFHFLSTVAIRPQISRIDLAHDDIEGLYLSVDWAEAQWSKGGYTARAGGRAPSIECVGNWHKPTGAGRTLYIGTRTSGKFCRFYEKGKKEGDANSPWCRVEVEFKSSDRIIPLDILLSPSGYFAGAYPCFSEFAHHPTVNRLELKQKTAQIVVDKAVDVTRHQFGKYLRVFRDLFGDKEALDLVCNKDKNAWPKRLKALTATAHTGPEALHKQFEVPSVPSFINFIQAVPSFGLNGANCY